MNYYRPISVLFYGTTTILDFLFYPIYFLLYQPWKELKQRRTLRSKTTYLSENEILVKPVASRIVQEVRANQPKVENIYERFKMSSLEFGMNDCFGTRRILREIVEKDEKNISIKKLYMEDVYRWDSYSSVKTRVDNVSVGLYSGTCLSSKDVVVIYADTCPEWCISALACFKINCRIATVYTNLGQNGVRYCLDVVKPKVIITSQHLLPNLVSILGKNSNFVKEIVYIANPLNQDFEEWKTNDSLIIHNFDDIEKLGIDMNGYNDISKLKPAKQDDVALIMFTSGSTGNPKGVELTHRNIIEGAYTMQAHFFDVLGCINYGNETYIAYLPLAHIFELVVEISSLCSGFRIAYSSPFTLTDNSLKIASGQLGDITLIKPTYMVAVPLVLNRVYKKITSAIKTKSPMLSHVFKLCYDYKCYWRANGMDTPILNNLLFKKLKRALGGNVKLILAGGAQLSTEVHQFFRTVICSKTFIGYGLTESSGIGGNGNEFDETGEFVVEDGVVVKLESWEEGGYLVNDMEGPGGEILLNSKTMAKSYYKPEDNKTRMDFVTDFDGEKWFRTGDIGRLNPKTKTLRIVDRRKDLIKLQMGEYVSLAKVETEMKMHPSVDLVCVYADPEKTATVALIIPNEEQLYEWADQLKLSYGGNARKDICQNLALKDYILNDIKLHVYGKLENFEIPKDITLIGDTWDPDSGLVTSSMKLKRKAIQKAYQGDIDKMYQNIEKSRLN